MPPKRSSGPQQPKNSETTVVPFQINTRRTVNSREIVVPPTSLTPIATKSRLQVSRIDLRQERYEVHESLCE